ncbi:MAG: hypothetical protein JNL57_10200 [Bacteroidetes bacterium]|nr:hypothetical protein [Bacteroidota bacterium]
MRADLFLLLSALCFNACKDKAVEPTPEPDITGKTRQEIFMVRPWRILNWKDSSKAGIFENIETCSHDNTYTFSTNSNLILDRGAVQCNSAELRTENMSWSMVSPNDTLVQVFNSSWRILSQTSRTMSIRNRNWDLSLNDYIYHTVYFSAF